MNIRNTTARWGSLAKAFHWIIVFFIIGQFVLASIAEDLPLGMEKLAVLARHKSVGITILGLAVLRLAWRWANPTPELPGTMKPYERVLANVTHGGLYLLLFAMPLSGWMMSSAKAYPVSWFNVVQLPDLVSKNEATFDVMHEAHEILATLLLVLAGLHVLGALKHQFIDKDSVLRRMLPFAKVAIAALAMGTAAAFSPDAAFAATTAAPAAASPAASAPRTTGTRLVSASTGSSLQFSFEQAGATNTGRFGKFTTTLALGPQDASGGSLRVDVDVASLDTNDKDRDSTLRGADLFDVARFARATFVSNTIARTGTDRYEATGSLTIRGVARDVKLPFTLSNPGANAKAPRKLSGEITIKRLAFGVGQGEWKSTEWVGDDVKIAYAVQLVPAPAAKRS